MLSILLAFEMYSIIAKTLLVIHWFDGVFLL